MDSQEKRTMSDAFRAYEDAAREAGFALREHAVEQLLADCEEGAPQPSPSAFVEGLLDVCFFFEKLFSVFGCFSWFLNRQT